MQVLDRNRSNLLWILIMIAVFSVAGHRLALAEGGKVSQVTFYVHWYDVGETALEGLKGIERVEKGFKNFKEINLVHYDPSLITIEEMEEALKRAKTYRGTVK